MGGPMMSRNRPGGARKPTSTAVAPSSTPEAVPTMFADVESTQAHDSSAAATESVPAPVPAGASPSTAKIPSPAASPVLPAPKLPPGVASGGKAIVGAGAGKAPGAPTLPKFAEKKPPLPSTAAVHAHAPSAAMGGVGVSSSGSKLPPVKTFGGVAGSVAARTLSAPVAAAAAGKPTLGGAAAKPEPEWKRRAAEKAAAAAAAKEAAAHKDVEPAFAPSPAFVTVVEEASAPAPAPSSEPAPAPAPAHVLEPAPVQSISPAPEPAPASAPAPVVPELVPAPALTAVPKLTPTPASELATEPSTVSVPEVSPSPAPVPASEAAPAPAPEATPVSASVPEPTKALTSAATEDAPTLASVPAHSIAPEPVSSPLLPAPTTSNMPGSVLAPDSEPAPVSVPANASSIGPASLLAQNPAQVQVPALLLAPVSTQAPLPAPPLLPALPLTAPGAVDPALAAAAASASVAAESASAVAAAGAALLDTFAARLQAAGVPVAALSTHQRGVLASVLEAAAAERRLMAGPPYAALSTLPPTPTPAHDAPPVGPLAVSATGLTVDLGTFLPVAVAPPTAPAATGWSPQALYEATVATGASSRAPVPLPASGAATAHAVGIASATSGNPLSPALLAGRTGVHVGDLTAHTHLPSYDSSAVVDVAQQQKQQQPAAAVSVASSQQSSTVAAAAAAAAAAVSRFFAGPAHAFERMPEVRPAPEPIGVALAYAPLGAASSNVGSGGALSEMGRGTVHVAGLGSVHVGARREAALARSASATNSRESLARALLNRLPPAPPATGASSGLPPHPHHGASGHAFSALPSLEGVTDPSYADVVRLRQWEGSLIALQDVVAELHAAAGPLLAPGRAETPLTTEAVSALAAAQREAAASMPGGAAAAAAAFHVRAVNLAGVATLSLPSPPAPSLPPPAGTSVSPAHAFAGADGGDAALVGFTSLVAVPQAAVTAAYKSAAGFSPTRRAASDVSASGSLSLTGGGSPLGWDLALGVPLAATGSVTNPTVLSPPGAFEPPPASAEPVLPPARAAEARRLARLRVAAFREPVAVSLLGLPVAQVLHSLARSAVMARRQDLAQAKQQLSAAMREAAAVEHDVTAPSGGEAFGSERLPPGRILEDAPTDTVRAYATEAAALRDGLLSPAAADAAVGAPALAEHLAKHAPLLARLCSEAHAADVRDAHALLSSTSSDAAAAAAALATRAAEAEAIEAARASLVDQLEALRAEAASGKGAAESEILMQAREVASGEGLALVIRGMPLGVGSSTAATSAAIALASERGGAGVGAAAAAVAAAAAAALAVPLPAVEDVAATVAARAPVGEGEVLLDTLLDEPFDDSAPARERRFAAMISRAETEAAASARAAGSAALAAARGATARDVAAAIAAGDAAVATFSAQMAAQDDPAIRAAVAERVQARISGLEAQCAQARTAGAAAEERSRQAMAEIARVREATAAAGALRTLKVTCRRLWDLRGIHSTALNPFLADAVRATPYSAAAHSRLQAAYTAMRSGFVPGAAPLEDLIWGDTDAVLAGAEEAAVSRVRTERSDAPVPAPARNAVRSRTPAVITSIATPASPLPPAGARMRVAAAVGSERASLEQAVIAAGTAALKRALGGGETALAALAPPAFAGSAAAASRMAALLAPAVADAGMPASAPLVPGAPADRAAAAAARATAPAAYNAYKYAELFAQSLAGSALVRQHRTGGVDTPAPAAGAPGGTAPVAAAFDDGDFDARELREIAAADAAHAALAAPPMTPRDARGALRESFPSGASASATVTAAARAAAAAVTTRAQSATMLAIIASPEAPASATTAPALVRRGVQFADGVAAESAAPASRAPPTRTATGFAPPLPSSPHVHFALSSGHIPQPIRRQPTGYVGRNGSLSSTRRSTPAPARRAASELSGLGGGDEDDDDDDEEERDVHTISTASPSAIGAGIDDELGESETHDLALDARALGASVASSGVFGAGRAQSSVAATSARALPRVRAPAVSIHESGAASDSSTAASAGAASAVAPPVTVPPPLAPLSALASAAAAAAPKGFFTITLNERGASLAAGAIELASRSAAGISSSASAASVTRVPSGYAFRSGAGGNFDEEPVTLPGLASTMVAGVIPQTAGREAHHYPSGAGDAAAPASLWASDRAAASMLLATHAFGGYDSAAGALMTARGGIAPAGTVGAFGYGSVGSASVSSGLQEAATAALTFDRIAVPPGPRGGPGLDALPPASAFDRAADAIEASLPPLSRRDGARSSSSSGVSAGAGGDAAYAAALAAAAASRHPHPAAPDVPGPVPAVRATAGATATMPAATPFLAAAAQGSPGLAATYGVRRVLPPATSAVGLYGYPDFAAEQADASAAAAAAQAELYAFGAAGAPAPAPAASSAAATAVFAPGGSHARFALDPRSAVPAAPPAPLSHVYAAAPSAAYGGGDSGGAGSSTASGAAGGALVYLPPYARVSDISSPAYYSTPTAGAVSGGAQWAGRTPGDTGGLLIAAAGPSVYARAPDGAVALQPDSNSRYMAAPTPGSAGTSGAAVAAAAALAAAATSTVAADASHSRFPRESPRFRYSGSAMGRSLARDAYSTGGSGQRTRQPAQAAAPHGAPLAMSPAIAAARARAAANDAGVRSLGGAQPLLASSITQYGYSPEAKSHKTTLSSGDGSLGARIAARRGGV